LSSTRVQLVTDSSAQLPPELIRKLEVEVVPVSVIVDEVNYREGEEIDVTSITAALERGARISTSTPSPGEFLQAYERCAEQGATEILSIHTGGAFSSTANTARLAAASAPVPVHVVDTGTASFPVGLCAWSAWEALQSGHDVEEAAKVASDVADGIDSVFVLGVPELAVRGGRLRPEAVQTVTPLVGFADGKMEVIGEALDPAGAVEMMVSYVVDKVDGQPLRVGVGHIGASEIADGLEAAIGEQVAVKTLVRYEVGPSIAAHTGLGTVGCVFHRL
jgi:DegV family protein with EDD domain